MKKTKNEKTSDAVDILHRRYVGSDAKKLAELERIPFLWVVLWFELVYLKNSLFYIALPSIDVIFVICFIFYPLWARVTAFTAAMPILILFWLCFSCLVLYPIRNLVHRFLIVFLEKMLNHKKGAIAFLTLLIGGVSALLALFLHITKTPLG